jgi:hypothetical protein
MKSLTVVDGYPTKKFFRETIAQFITRETVSITISIILC